MSALQLKVECFAGASIDGACREAIRLADQLQIVVTFKFNEVTCVARPGDSPIKLAQSWGEALKSNRSFKLACHSQVP